MIKGYITLKQASEISGKEVEALKKQCQDGRIRGAIKQGKAWFVPHSEIIVGSGAENGTLGFLLSMIEAAGPNSSASVTLVSNGAFIQGELIGRKEYIGRFRNDLLNNMPFAEKDNAFKEFADKYFNDLEGRDEVGTPSFIHLKIVSTSQIADGETVKESYLRIKYEAVDGFLLGSIGRGG